MTPDKPQGNAPRHLWIVNHYADHPSDIAGALRHQCLASSLTNSGWSTTIFAATTLHATRRQRSSSTIAANLVNGVRWNWIRCPDYTAHGLLRLWNMLVFSVRVVLPNSTSSATPPDVIMGSTVHPLAAWAAMRLARRYKVPFVFEVRDLWPETLIDMGAIRRNGVVARLMRLLEAHLYRSASLIITTMPAASDYITSFGIERDRIVWISNGTDVNAFSVTPPPMNAVFEFLYCGSHGSANDLERILHGFHAASRELGTGSTRLKLVGNGPLKAALIEEATRIGLGASVEFHDPVPKSDIPDLTASADAVVVSLLPLRLYRFGISLNKLFDYLAAARPILLAGDPINNAVRDANAGVCRSGNSVEEISGAMIELYRSSYEERAEWGRNGHEHVKEHYSFEHLAERLDSHLRPLVKNSDR